MLVKGATGEMGPSSLHRQVISNNVYDWIDILNVIFTAENHRKYTNLTGDHLIKIDNDII